MRTLSILLLILGLQPASSPQWADQPTGATARFRGVSAVDDRIAWASGTAGTVARTLDGGINWESFIVPGAESLDLRDIEAFGADTAYALSIGPGEQSRIFKTVDGGTSWQTQFVNQETAGFFDAMAFWDADRGVAVSDSVVGRFYVVRTEDGGSTWTRVAPQGLPPALPGEGYFAASGTNVVTWAEQHVWFGTGAGQIARVARSTDSGTTWEIVDTPLPAGPSSGIFSVAFRDADNGVVVGGDYRLEDQAVDNAAITRDGGRTWSFPQGRGLSGFRSAVAYIPSASPPALLAIGPTGADMSIDDGESWAPVESPVGMHTLSFAPGAPVAWAAGENGRVSRALLEPRGAPPGSYSAPR